MASECHLPQAQAPGVGMTSAEAAGGRVWGVETAGPESRWRRLTGGGPGRGACRTMAGRRVGWSGGHLSCRPYSSVSPPSPLPPLNFQRLWASRAPRTKPSVPRPSAAPCTEHSPVCVLFFLFWIIVGVSRTLLWGEQACSSAVLLTHLPVPVLGSRRPGEVSETSQCS